jgi:uncharacterized protein DUF5648
MTVSSYRNIIRAVLCCAPFVAGSASAVQTVQSVNTTRNGVAVASPVFVASGDVVKFDAMLTANGAQNPPGTSGLGVCLEYNAAAAGNPTLGGFYFNGNVGRGTPTALSACNAGGAANVPGADTMVVNAWAGISEPWPNAALPIKLYDATFTLPSTPSGATRIGFGASAVANGESFTTNSAIVLCGKPTVSVLSAANGAETGPSAAAFNVSLSSAVPAECSAGGSFAVTLNLAGTAALPGSANADYTIGGPGVTNAGGTVTATFPADGSTTQVTVLATPVADGQGEGVETVTLIVAAGNGNYAGVGASATANIVDGAAPTSVVVEYLNTTDFPGSPGGHYFYSSDPAEQAAVDAGAAGDFHRTGREFLTGGSVPVCRFYGSVTPGPNSHFFTAEAAECQALKNAQVTPKPTTVQQWNYERDEYLTTLPVVVNGTRACPAGTQPLYRAYNNAFPPSGPKNPWDSNHRFTPVLNDITALVALGWRDEGIAFCTPQ